MNKKLLWLSLGGAVGIAGAFAVYFIFLSTGPAPTDSTRAEDGKRVLYWRDPMNPTMRSDKPGKSPMGMEMVPVYEGEAGGGIKIDPTTVQNIGVRYETAQRRALSKTIRTVGKVDYDEKRLYFVNTKISGWVEKLYVNYTGKFVKKGEPLLEIYSPELVSAEEEYIIAFAYKDTDPDQAELFRRAHRKLMYWDIPHDQINRLEQTRQPEKTMALVAPETGVVVEKNVLEGGNIMAGTDLYKIADLSTVWVYADIYEYEVPFVKVGQEANVTLAYTPGEVFTGKVSYIFPYLNSETRTIRVRIEIPNPLGALKPEMFATVELQSPLAVEAVAVPEQAVIHSGERNVVVVALGDGRFESRNVSLGVLAGGYYQVLDGINEGESIVVSSQFLIDSESNLKAVLQGMSAGSGSTADSTRMIHEGNEPMQDSGAPGHRPEETDDSGSQNQHQGHSM